MQCESAALHPNFMFKPTDGPIGNLGPTCSIGGAGPSGPPHDHTATHGHGTLTPIGEAEKILKQTCPYGHPEFIPLLIKTAQLHSDKNHDYAAGGIPLGNFERVATILGMYPDMELDDPVVIMMIYMLKQLDAVLWHLNTDIKHKVEGPISRLEDIHVYSGLAICKLKDKENAN